MKTLATLLIVAAALTSPANAQDSTRSSPLGAPDSIRASMLGVEEGAHAPADPTVVADTHPYRSPGRALILGSLIPGAGHIYAGEYSRGIRTYEVTVSTIGLGAMTFFFDRCMLSFLSTTSCESGPRWPYQAAGVAIAGLGLWQWVSSARDAPRAAERANERHGRRTARARPIIEAPVGSAGSWRAGVALPW